MVLTITQAVIPATQADKKNDEVAALADVIPHNRTIISSAINILQATSEVLSEVKLETKHTNVTSNATDQNLITHPHLQVYSASKTRIWKEPGVLAKNLPNGPRDYSDSENAQLFYHSLNLHGMTLADGSMTFLTLTQNFNAFFISRITKGEASDGLLKRSLGHQISEDEY
ncbi:hypothetical protein FQR65_LT10484 [Abscondita terminalis]|nr:hypothetical protein FQR65_LT10484 [Abscondita terminalis]